MASVPPDGGSILPDGWTWSDVGHGALDVAGLVPFIGEAADLANAAWLASEGQYLDAGLSIVSMIPVVGDIVGKGGKLATKGAGKLAGPALDALKKIDFKKMLEPLATHPKIGPHVEKISEALEKWRKEVVGDAPSPKLGGVQPCPNATKALGESAAMIGKTPVPTRILEKLSPQQLKIFEDAIGRVDSMPAPRPDKAVFYSGKVGDTWAWEVAEASARSGNFDSVNTLTGNLLNADEIRKSLPRDAAEFVDNLASKRLADTAQGAVTFVGEVEKIGPNSVFRNVELPALLNNPNISESSRRELTNMKYFLDSKYGK